MVTELDGVGRAASKSEAERRARGRSSVGGGGDRGGNPPQRRMRAALAWAAVVTGAYALSTMSVATAR
jgi:hypothetical protein